MVDEFDKYFNLLDALADSVIDMDADELYADVLETGISPDQTRNLLLSVTKDFQQKKLREAEGEYKRKLMSYYQTNQEVPTDSKILRALLNTFLLNNPDIRKQLTLQHRDFEMMSDEDLRELLKELRALGIKSESVAEGD